MPRVATIRSDVGAHATVRASSASAGIAGLVRSSTQNNIVLPATDAIASTATATAARRLGNAGQRGLRLQLSAGSRACARAAAAAPPPGPDPAPAAPASGATGPEPPQPEPMQAGGDSDLPLLKKYTVNIEALDNFELLRYIPVTIEPLGERVFVAEASELSLSMTGRTPEDAVRLLKDAVARTYDANRTRRNTLDADRRRQQRILETYIGKPKGVWHWA